MLFTGVNVRISMRGQTVQGSSIVPFFFFLFFVPISVHWGSVPYVGQY